MQLELKREREHEASLKTAAEKEVASLKERLADMEAHANARWVVGHADLIMFIRLLEPVLVGADRAQCACSSRAGLFVVFVGVAGEMACIWVVLYNFFLFWVLFDRMYAGVGWRAGVENQRRRFLWCLFLRVWLMFDPRSWLNAGVQNQP